MPPFWSRADTVVLIARTTAYCQGDPNWYRTALEETANLSILEKARYYLSHPRTIENSGLELCGDVIRYKDGDEEALPLDWSRWPTKLLKCWVCEAFTTAAQVYLEDFLDRKTIAWKATRDDKKDA
ncbi:hypothetical protein F5Y16DRAFT_399040 [Xylariaceae sp. FL0255]|nr:hypothetical protein F5Y16DRAFT_399040 [Xylariaceae sp. FL0255]